MIKTETIIAKYKSSGYSEIENAYEYNQVEDMMIEYGKEAITTFMNKSEEWLHCYGGSIDDKWIEEYKNNLK